MNFTTSVMPRSRIRFNQSGFSIVELMIAMTVTLFIIGALMAVVLGSASTGRSRDAATDLQTNGRYALQKIKDDLLHAGFLGISSLFWPEDPITAWVTATPITVTDACDAATVGLLSERIWGANDANPFAATCIPAANYSTGDVLMIRALDPIPTSGPYSAARVYFRSAYEGGEPFVGPTPPDLTLTSKNAPYVDYEMQETAYYVSPYTTSAAEDPLVPALFRVRLGDGPAMVPELVATGVENFQVQYGVYQSATSIRYLAANAMSAADWDLVKSVQVWLLLRSPRPDPDYDNNNTYTMGTQNIVVNDNFRRLLLSSVIELRN